MRCSLHQEPDTNPPCHIPWKRDNPNLPTTTGVSPQA